MSLLVALALSDLEPEQWPNQFNHICGTNITKTFMFTLEKKSRTELSPECVKFFSLFDQHKPNDRNSSESQIKEFILQTFKQAQANKIRKKDVCVSESSDDQTIMYGGRNLLDLRSNITGNWDLTPAILLDDIATYFQNRSQVSWLKGASPPSHVMITCKTQNCKFEQPIYL